LPPAALSTRAHVQLRGTRHMMVVGVLAHNHDAAPPIGHFIGSTARSSFGQRQVAAQLKSVVLLDDQLVQSDPTRLEWFRQALRTTVRDQQHQVLVFTCRTGDYLTQDELPKPTESQHESDEGRLLSTDLEKVIRRVDRP
jgi:hypothetical protein